MIRVEEIGNKPRTTEETATLDRPLDHLLACHRRIEERLAVLERAANHLEDRRGEALTAIGNSIRFLDSNGVWHTADEEESVFPRIAGRISEENRRFLQDLEAQHRDAEKHVEDLRAVYSLLISEGDARPDRELPQRFREAVAALCADYRKHIAAEDERLLPLARSALNEVELKALSREMRIRRGLTAEAERAERAAR
ncbi:MAG: hemerythrin domain-containing protein [Bryobacterales bacterium]|nr:hemerythrin domain-containing protein [Bryobacterales bacterium]